MSQLNDSNALSFGNLPPLRVLVVDDNRTNLQILQIFLKKLGHTPLPAENGEEAVALWKSWQPDIVLLDIMMPVMDGFEAARQIRLQARERWTPIVFLSALDRDENLVAGLEAGGDDFMSKPINFVVLEAKMRSMQRMIHLQRKAIETLKRIQIISDSVIDAIVTINTQGSIVACNAACERIFGWDLSEMIGQNVNILMPEPHRSEHDAYIREFVQGGPPRVIGFGREVMAVRKDGSHFPMELGISEVRIDQERLFIGIMRDISDRKNAERQLLENARQLQAYYEENEAEAQLARTLIEQQLQRPGLCDSKIHYWLTPAKNFSGDVVAAARSAEGKLYAMLADATGHGLTAAISALPVVTGFYALVGNGLPLGELVGELNRQLKQSVPIGRFVAATLVCIDYARQELELWVGGTPEVFLIDAAGKVCERASSQHLPLGILETDSALTVTTKLTWTNPCQLVVCSDGLIEAANRDDASFGTEGLLTALQEASAHFRHRAVRSALERHLEDIGAHDDVSLLLIDCAH